VLYGGHEAITRVVENMVNGFGGGKQGWIANLGHGTFHQFHGLFLSSTNIITQASHPSSSPTISSSTSPRSTGYQVDESHQAEPLEEECQPCSSSIDEIRASRSSHSFFYVRAENARAQHPSR
jgi:hypothetical protein